LISALETRISDSESKNKELEEDVKELKSKLTASQTSWFRQKLPFGKEKQSKVVALNCATVLSNKNNNPLPIVPIVGIIIAIVIASVVIVRRKQLNKKNKG